MIYLHEHFPAHVHVSFRGGELVIDLNCLDDEPEIRDVYRLKAREVRSALTVIGKHRGLLCRMWKEIHGNV